MAERGKIEISQSIREVQDDIKEQSNSVRRWIKENGYIAVEPNGAADPRWRPMKEIMRDYRDYCHDYSELSKSPKAVAKVLRDLGIRSKRCSDTTWYCLGIGPYSPDEPSTVEESNTQAIPVQGRRDSSIPGIDVPVSIFKNNNVALGGIGAEEDLPF